MEGTEGLEGLLEYIREPAVAVCGGNITFGNKRARELTGIKPPCPVVIQERGEGISLIIDEASYAVSRVGLYETEIYIIAPMDAAEGHLTLIENASVSIRNALMVNFSTVGLLVDRFEDREESDTLKYLGMLRHNLFKISNLINNLDGYIAFSRGGGRLNRGLTDLNSLCSGLVGSVSALLESEGISLIFKSFCNDAVIEADSIKLENMLLALLENSFKYTSKGGGISLTLKKNEGMFLISITDNGQGISEEATSTVFEDYNRAFSLEDTQKGAGLGLTAALHVAKLHGGNIFIGSTTAGTTVTVGLPSKKPAETVRAPSELYGEDAMRRVLTGLSHVLSFDKYLPPYLD